MANFQQIRNVLGKATSWLGGNAQQGGKFDRALYDSLKKDGMDASEAGRIATGAKGGGLISTGAKIGGGVLAASALTGGGITAWLGNQSQKVAGEWEQTQAYLENLNSQTQGINKWVRILSFINAIFPTDYVTKMIDDRLQKVAEINDRMKKNGTGAFTDEKDQGLLERLSNGVVAAPLADTALVVGGGALATKLMTGSWNPLKLFGGGNTPPTTPPTTPPPSGPSFGGIPAASANGPTAGNGPTSGPTTRTSSVLGPNSKPLEIPVAAPTPTTSVADVAKDVAAEAGDKVANAADDVAKAGLGSRILRGIKGNALMTGVVAAGMFVGSKVFGATNEQALDNTKPLIPYADAAEKALEGDTAGAEKSAIKQTGALAGFFAGAAAGGAVGLGFLGLGAIPGAVFGGLAGVGGSVLGDYLGEKVADQIVADPADFGPSPKTTVADFKAAVDNSPIVASPEMAAAVVPQEMGFDVGGLGAMNMGGSFSSSAAPVKAHDAISTPQPKHPRTSRKAPEAVPAGLQLT